MSDGVRYCGDCGAAAGAHERWCVVGASLANASLGGTPGYAAGQQDDGLRGLLRDLAKRLEDAPDGDAWDAAAFDILREAVRHGAGALAAAEADRDEYRSEWESACERARAADYDRPERQAEITRLTGELAAVEAERDAAQTQAAEEQRAAIEEELLAIAANAAAAQMREALERARINVIAGTCNRQCLCGNDTWLAEHNANVDAALAIDAGKGWVSGEEHAAVVAERNAALDAAACAYVDMQWPALVDADPATLTEEARVVRAALIRAAGEQAARSLTDLRAKLTAAEFARDTAREYEQYHAREEERMASYAKVCETRAAVMHDERNAAIRHGEALESELRRALCDCGPQDSPAADHMQAEPRCRYLRALDRAAGKEG